MATCPLCERDMLDTEACIDRRLVFGNPTPGEIERTGAEGDVVTPIPFGEESSAMTYDERLTQYEDEIEAGGRGNLGVAETRRMRDGFLDTYPDAASYRSRTCHDCGVRVGELHHPGCDMEECPNPDCDERQLFMCDCRPHVLTESQESSSALRGKQK